MLQTKEKEKTMLQVLCVWMCSWHWVDLSYGNGPGGDRVAAEENAGNESKTDNSEFFPFEFQPVG